jgi:hypothetical protein
MKAETALAPGMRQHVAHEVHPPALPAGMEHPGDRGFDAFVGIRDHQLDPAQSTAGEATQELGPERFGFGGTECHAQDLAPAVCVDPDGDDHRHRHDPSALAYLQLGGVNPQVGPIAFQRAVQEGVSAKRD